MNRPYQKSMQSMTGIGRARAKFNNTYFVCETRSVNHRFCDVSVKLPPKLQSLEISLNQKLKKRIHRGKIDLWIGEETTAQASKDEAQDLKNVYLFLKKIQKDFKLKDPITLSHLISAQNMVSSKKVKETPDEKFILNLAEKAIFELEKMRQKEGEKLTVFLSERLKTLEKILKQVEAKREEILQNYHSKLKEKVAKLLGYEITSAKGAMRGRLNPALPVEGATLAPMIDPQKVAQEVAILAEKTDTTEELERLTAHFNEARKVFHKKEPVGRTLDFLIQEINREWNTLGSKCQDFSMAHLVVEAKSELEKMREQVQNIE